MSDEQPSPDDKQEKTRPPDEAELADRARASRAETDELKREARGDEEDGEHQPGESA